MNISGTLTQVIQATGVASVDSYQWNGVTGTVVVRFRLTPAQGPPVIVQQKITGDSFAALPSPFGPDDLLDTFVSVNNLTNLDAVNANPPNPVQSPLPPSSGLDNPSQIVTP